MDTVQKHGSCINIPSSQTYCLLILHPPHPLQKLGALKPILRVGKCMLSPHYVIKHLKCTFLESTSLEQYTLVF
jgi:hypothetical protein